ncbi:MAG: HNH endonuclease [Armatimonadetes bacterium]|nr:HNH endonuclease [Armatimonadota bacterium]
MAAQGGSPARRRVLAQPGRRREAPPVSIRILLGALHEGRCQLCGFTFLKRDGQPYYEVHHLDPDLGHHPKNLLLVCANCHAQLEQATVTGCEYVRGWLVSLEINGVFFSVRQPLLADGDALLSIAFVLVFASWWAARLLPGGMAPVR